MSTRPCPDCGSSLPPEAAYCDQCGSATHTQVLGETDTAPVGAEIPASYQHQPEGLQRALGDQFELGPMIGRGGYAEVYAVRDRKLQRDLAIKVLRPDLILTPALLGRFRREALSVAALQHPAIVPVFDVGEQDGICYIVMPLIRGESLKALLQRQRRLPFEQVRRIVGEVAEALEVAHEAGLVHRDIKPENIMLEGRDGHVRVMDFGIAKAVDSSEKELTGTGVVVGTPQYMSPEQASGEPQIDPRSDQYSLAVLAYQMVSGRAPFDGETARAIIAKQLLDQPPKLDTLVDNVPQNVVDALHRAMQKQPAKRFDRITEFAAALVEPEYRNPQSLLTEAPAAPAKPAQWAPWAAATLAAVALATVAYTQLRPPRPPALPLDSVPSASPDPNPASPPTPAAVPDTPAVGPRSAPLNVVVARPGQDSTNGTDPIPLAPGTRDTTPAEAAPTPACVVLVDQQDWVRAATQCISEGQAGNARSSRLAAELLLEGRGAIPRDEGRARQLYTQAATAGDAEAQFWMGDRLLASEPSEATTWFLKAARQGLAKAYPRVAERLYRGLGTAVDASAAFTWFQRAAESGDVASQRRLGEMYAAGVGVAKDEAAARKWYEQAGDPTRGKDSEAQYQLAQIYFRGRGVKKSDEEGMRWLRRAAAAGHLEAQKELARRGADNPA